MGQLLLCANQLAKEPFYLDNMSLHIFSLEEMSYYLVHNTDFVDVDIMSSEFITWVEKEIGDEKLADSLQKLVAQNVKLYQYAEYFLQMVGYATKDELAHVKGVLIQLENKDELEQHKMRADKLLAQNKYAMAMQEYLGILKKLKEDTTNEFEGSIYHNLATAHARMFLYARAMQLYEMAYALNGKEESLRRMCYAGILCGDSERMREFMKEHNQAELFLECENHILLLQTEAEQDDVSETIEDMNRDYAVDFEEEYEQQIKLMIDTWKKKYRVYSR